LTLSHRVQLIVAGFVLAVLSWRFVETPFRTRQFCASRHSIFRFSIVGIACLLTIGGLIVWREGFYSRTSHVEKYANARYDSAFVNEMTIEDVQHERFIPFGVELNKPPTVLVWGDSHAMAALPAFDQCLKQHGLKGFAATRSSTLPVLGYFYPSRWGLNEQAIPFNEAIVEFAQRKGITDVVLVAFWNNVGSNDPDLFKVSLLNTIARLTKTDVRVWIMQQVPMQPFDVPKALVKAAWTGKEIDIAEYCAKSQDSNGILEQDGAFLEQLKSVGSRILDPRPSFLREDGRYAIIKDDVPLYRDNHHLSMQGARLMLVPMLNESFIPVVTGVEP